MRYRTICALAIVLFAATRITVSETAAQTSAAGQQRELPNWMRRGSPANVILPKLPDVKLASG